MLPHDDNRVGKIAMADRSLFDGMDSLIGSALKLNPGEHLKQKATCRKLKPEPGSQDIICSLVSDLYGELSSRQYHRIPSRENWRLERVTNLDPKNKSPEVALERAIAVVADNGSLKS